MDFIWVLPQPGGPKGPADIVDDSIVENGGGDWGERFRNSFGTIFL